MRAALVGVDHGSAPMAAASDGIVARHIHRFGKVSTRYAHRVIEAYDVDLRRAQADTDVQVATRVAEWERVHGLQPRDWYAIGRYERGEIPACELGPVERQAVGLLADE
jgi:hypothetical protein